MLSVKEYFVRSPPEARPGQYLVTPYCVSGSLQAHLLGSGSGLKSCKDRLKIARGIAAGLAELHVKRIFHRDIKPDNVLLTAKLEPRLADFGVSRVVGGGAEIATSYATVHQVGTAGYAAPEVQFGKYGPKTDAYAAGVVLLQLATGKPAVMVDESGSVPRPLREHLLAQPGIPSSGLPDFKTASAEWASFAAGQADPRCAWPPTVASGLMLLGLRCTEKMPRARPFAAEILLVIDDLLKSDGGVSSFGRRPDLLASETALLCTICEEALAECVMLPCNHATSCGPCAAKLDRCPLCRSANEGTRRADGPVLQVWQGPAGGGRVWLPASALSVADDELAYVKAYKRRKEAEQEAGMAVRLAGNSSRLPMSCHGHGLPCRGTSMSDLGIACEKGHFACKSCLEKQTGAVSSPFPQYPASSTAKQLACEACWRADSTVTPYSNAALASYVDESRDRSSGLRSGLVDVHASTLEFAFVAQNILDRGLEDGDDRGRTQHWRQRVIIASVQRVENSVLWQEYQDLRHRIAQRPHNNGVAGEVWCKHGTGQTPPNIIWSSDLGSAGIDTRYTSGGSVHMLGYGAYFSTHAAYSRMFAFQDGIVQKMFLVRLAAGTPEDRAINDSKHPPCNEIRHPSSGFDCVRGSVGGPGLAYVSYIPYQNYPAYLVTYHMIEPPEEVDPPPATLGPRAVTVANQVQGGFQLKGPG